MAIELAFIIYAISLHIHRRCLRAELAYVKSLLLLALHLLQSNSTRKTTMHSDNPMARR